MPKQKQVSPEDRRRAQELAYQGMMSVNGEQALKLSTQALELDPRCTDAMLIITRMPLDPEQAIESLREIVEMALEDLGGEEYLEENRGLCWGLLASRPYMRARANLALELEDAGRLEEAIAECEAMLELNPEDHQGMRHALLGCYLKLADFDGVRSVLDRYGVDQEAMMAWAHVLERFAAGDEPGAARALAIARGLNPHFESFATGRGALPLDQTGMYVKGEDSEAAFIANTIGDAWLQQPGLDDWMAGQLAAGPLIGARRVGRNDPCPCGSGKKYKKCCLGKAAATPGVPAIRHSAPGTTPTQAESFLHGLKAEMGDREFASDEELNEFVQQYQQQVNRRPLADFHGLSPDQMLALTHRPFESPQLLEFPAVLAAAPSGPLAEIFAMLVDWIGNDGLKPTATGNLPRKVIREIARAHMGEEDYANYTQYCGINSEADYWELRTVRFTAEQAGLIRKYKGRFILSRKCRGLLDRDGLRAVYPLLFRTFAERVNWSSLDVHPQLGHVQQSFAYSLYLLDLFGDEWRASTFYEDEILRAFPSLIEEVGPVDYVTPEEALRLAYSHRCLNHFAGLTGLIEFDANPLERFVDELMLRRTPLFDQVVKFHVS